jgi:streptogramin lyase
VRLTRADRRRLAFASALTAVAFPAVLWEHERGDVVNRSNIAAVGVPAAGEEAVAAPGPSAPLAEPAYLAPIDDPAGTAAGASVMVGRSDDELVGRGEATFRREVERPDVCWYDGIDDGGVVTVLNPANGRTVRCRVVRGSADGPGTVVLSPGGFEALADFSEAPIHVEIRR